MGSINKRGYTMMQEPLLEIILLINSETYKEAIESIVSDQKSYFREHVHLILLNVQDEEEVNEYCQHIQTTYSGNVKYLRMEGESKAISYNIALEHVKGRYVNFTTSNIIYEKDTLEKLGAYIENNTSESTDYLYSIHTHYVKDLSSIGEIEHNKKHTWNYSKTISYLPLFIDRYFIRNDIVLENHFQDNFQEEATKDFLIRCLAKQSTVTMVAETMIHYSELQERNFTTYKIKDEKWWYNSQMKDMIIPLLEDLKVDGQVPRHVQNLVFYLIRIKFYYNTNKKYKFAIVEEEVDEFIGYVNKALQYIDDSVILGQKNIVVTPKYMSIYFLKLKRDIMAESYPVQYRHGDNNKLDVMVDNQKIATSNQVIVSLQGFRTDEDTKERVIEAELFLHYVLDPERCRLLAEANGKPVEIRVNHIQAEEKCFNRRTKKIYRFSVIIPKKDRRMVNKVRFYLEVEGIRYEIVSKYARRKLVKRIQSRIKGGRLFPLFQRIAHVNYIVLYNVFKVCCRQRKNQVAMLSDSRAELSGNLAFIDEELKLQGYDVQYFFKRKLKEQKTQKEVRALCKMMAQSKYILVDDFYPIIYPIKLRRGTKLIQVWHAMGAFKTVGFSRLGKPGGPNPRSLTHRNYTAAITSAEGIRKDYAEAFGISIDKVFPTGVPRTDIFFDQQYIAEVRERLYQTYPILKRKKVVLFAPTFRGAGQNSAHYNFDWIDFDRIEKELGDDYIFIVKLHPFIKNTDKVPVDNPMFLDLTFEREINDLLFVTDILITDYSSVIFEASLLNIDTIFYVPDLESYTEGRDFYYPFERYTFGQVVENMPDLITSIKEPKTDIEKLEAFKHHFCNACDGNATKRFVDTLFEKR